MTPLPKVSLTKKSVFFDDLPNLLLQYARLLWCLTLAQLLRVWFDNNNKKHWFRKITVKTDLIRWRSQNEADCTCSDPFSLHCPLPNHVPLEPKVSFKTTGKVTRCQKN